MVTPSRYIPLSRARRLVCDLMRYAKKLPTIPNSRTIVIPELVAARRAAPVPVSWAAIFIRAFGLVARRHPKLRQCYVAFPWPRIYEHESSHCSVVVEREWAGEPIVLTARVRRPEEAPLLEIDGHIRRFRDDPLKSIPDFVDLLRYAKLPVLLRRLVLWAGFHLYPPKRIRHFGTFMFTSLAKFGVQQEHSIALVTSNFTVGPIDSAGRATARIVYDHRVMDGRDVARALVDIEATLNGEVLAELRALRAKEAA
jgi:hypothetical protein